MTLRLASFLKAGSKQSCQLVPNSMLSNDISQCQLCYLGEKHHSKTVLQSQLQVLQSLKEWSIGQENSCKIAIVFEMFNMKQQRSLNKYHSSNDNNFSLKELQLEYDVTGTEGFDIQYHYGELLKYSRQNSDLFHVFGGFPPREMAKLFVNKGTNDKSVWNQVFGLLQIDEKKDEHNEKMKELLRDMIINGNENHYQYFRYLLSDKVVPFNQMIKDKETGLYDKYGSIFVAQCFKDTIMAYNIMKLWLTNEYDKIVIIAGHGHLDCRYGVSERVEQLLQFNNVNTSELNEVIVSCQIEKEIVDTPWEDTCGHYILFIDSSGKQ